LSGEDVACGRGRKVSGVVVKIEFFGILRCAQDDNKAFFLIFPFGYAEERRRETDRVHWQKS
jgi:hypothetical protein